MSIRAIDSSLERPDGLEFTLGELVKVKLVDEWVYFHVLQDNRKLSYCTYTYTLIEPKDVGRSSSEAVPVYCFHPKDIVPTNLIERLLYGRRVRW